MSAFSARVADVTGVAEAQLERLAGGDLSEVLLLRRADGRCTVAKGGSAVATEAAMLRALSRAGVAVPAVEGEFEGVLLLEHVKNDNVFSPAAWGDIGGKLKALHERTGRQYGWPVDYRLGPVALDNAQGDDWPRFWGEQRLTATASVLDRPWRERVAAVTERLDDLLPAAPPPAFLHGDLWSGNILVRQGKLASLIDPACYGGDAEVDLAMLTLFDTPPDEFRQAYGPLRDGWELRRPIYQLFPALVHLRLFGASYSAMVERLLGEIEAQSNS